MNSKLERLIELNQKLDTIAFMGGEWIDVTINGKKAQFKNTEEAQQVMSGGGSSDEKFEMLRKAGLARTTEMSAKSDTIEFRRYEEEGNGFLGNAALAGGGAVAGAGALGGGLYLAGRKPYGADRLSAFKQWKGAGLSQPDAARMVTSAYGSSGSPQRIGGTVGRGVQRIGDYAGNIGSSTSEAWKGGEGFLSKLWNGAKAIPRVRFSSRLDRLVEINAKLDAIQLAQKH